MNYRIDAGQQGESIVAQHLEKEGYKIIDRNYRQRYGEIDLIASRDEVLCFVEVKTRSTEYFPTSLVVTKSKQLKIIRTARNYALRNGIRDKVLRFDVAIVIGSADAFNIRYLPNAFTHEARRPY